MAGEVKTPYLSGNGALWLQVNGPNTAPVYLGCHMLGDVEEPLGDVTILRCPDPSAPNLWLAVGVYQDPPDLVTTSIETDVRALADYLENVVCPATLFIHMTTCGRLDTFTSFERSFIMGNMYVTSRGLSGLRTKDEQGRANMTFEISGLPPLLRVFELTSARQSVSETRDLQSVTLCGELRCAGTCGAATLYGDSAVAVGEAVSGPGSVAGTGNVDITADGGADGWPAAATDPFGAGEDVISVACFRIGRDTTRIIVARGTTDAGNPAEVAYSDDSGATWTQVSVGTVNGQYASGRRALFALDQFHVWLCTSDGYIYFSEDGGATWTAQEEGVITGGAEDFQGIYFSDPLNGMVGGTGDTIAVTADGGDTWSAATATGSGSEITHVTYSDNFWWAITGNGRLYYTRDFGDTWTRRRFSGDGVGTCRDIDFLNGLFGILIHNTAAPVGRVLYTIDGGFTWQTLSVPTNAGLNAVRVAAANLAYVVGNAQGGTAVVLKIFPKTQ